MHNTENVSTQKYDFKRRLCAQIQDLQIFKRFYMSKMNPKEFVPNTAYSVQLPYIAGLSLKVTLVFINWHVRFACTHFFCYRYNGRKLSRIIFNIIIR